VDFSDVSPKRALLKRNLLRNKINRSSPLSGCWFQRLRKKAYDDWAAGLVVF